MPWIRYIKPAEELETLRKRQQKSYNPHSCYHKTEDNKDFDPLSAFHYHVDNVYQFGFSDRKKNIGIYINRDKDNPREVFWRHSGITEVSDHIFKDIHTRESFTESLEHYKFKSISENNIPSIVKKDFRSLVKEYKGNEKEWGEPCIPWTEGLFRYRASEIYGILVDKDNKETHKAAYRFVKVLEGKFKTKRFETFYYYDNENHKFHELSRDQIKKAYEEKSEKESLGVHTKSYNKNVSSKIIRRF